MTVNDLIRKLRWETMLTTLDIPITINGKEIIDIEYINKEPKGDGSYGSIVINLKSE